MITNDDVRDRLAKLGERADLQPSPGFVALLDERLRAGVEDYVPNTAYVPPRAPRGVPRKFVLAFAAAVLVVALSIGGLITRSTPSYAMTLSDPVNVSVVMPDGRIVTGTDGMRLADGARVIVGVGGSARIGDRHLTEGAVALVEGQAVRVLIADPAPTIVTTTQLAPEPTTVVTTSIAPVAPPPTEVPRRPAVTEPPVTEAPAPPPTEAPRPAPTTTVRPPEQNFNLNVQLIVGDGRNLTLKWRLITGATTYVITRTWSADGTPAEPAYPANQIATTTQLQWSEVVPAGIHTVRYRVVALDAAGRIVSQPSPFVQATLP